MNEVARNLIKGEISRCTASMLHAERMLEKVRKRSREYELSIAEFKRRIDQLEEVLDENDSRI